MATRYLKIKTPKGDFTVAENNAKVLMPIVNTEAALDCSSAKWCDFSGIHYRAKGRRRCYAQATELRRPTALKSRRQNSALIIEYGYALGIKVADAILAKLTAKRGAWSFDTVRINESGDLSPQNIAFVEAFTVHMRTNGIGVFLYSKAAGPLRERAAKAGATVLRSEIDFRAYKTEADMQKADVTPCRGQCGPCRLCPDFNGNPIGIVEH